MNKQGRGETGTSYSRQIRVIADKSIQLSIGGKGRPITASIQLPEGMAEKINWERVQVQLRGTLPSPTIPEELNEWPCEQQMAWRNKWLESEEGKAYQLAQEKATHYSTKLKEQHSFRLEDIEPGDYTLNIRFQEKTQDRNQWNGSVLGTITKQITVEPIKGGGYSAEVLDLGKLELDTQ